jgi:hypothetical protein
LLVAVGDWAAGSIENGACAPDWTCERRLVLRATLVGQRHQGDFPFKFQQALRYHGVRNCACSTLLWYLAWVQLRRRGGDVTWRRRVPRSTVHGPRSTVQPQRSQATTNLLATGGLSALGGITVHRPSSIVHCPLSIPISTKARPVSRELSPVL